MTEEIKKQIRQLGIPENNMLFDEPMSKHTTFKVGGPAECYIKIQDIQDLRKILKSGYIYSLRNQGITNVKKASLAGLDQICICKDMRKLINSIP